MNKRNVILTTITTLCMIAIFVVFYLIQSIENTDVVRVGFIYEGDASTPYTANFMKAQQEIEKVYGDKVQCVAFYNVKDANIQEIYNDVVASDCDIIFATSYGYGETVKEWAKKHPNIQFCHATGDLANSGEVLSNFHNYMGTIYQGRYVAGVVAGAKLKEAIAQGKVSPDRTKIGYVGAFPYAEVISGYTAFYMGVYSQVPTVTMQIIYTNSWSDYSKEKIAAKKLIENGCTIISQHSDTIGPAVACQELSDKYTVYHVGYNGSMIDVAPTTSLISSKINWAHYEVQAVGALFEKKNIEKSVKAQSVGMDSFAGFDKGWVEILGVNEYIMANGTNELIDSTIKKLEKGEIEVFSGNFTGTNPFDPSDVIDLSKQPFKENSIASSPMFHYVLDDVMEVIED